MDMSHLIMVFRVLFYIIFALHPSRFVVVVVVFG